MQKRPIIVQARCLSSHFRNKILKEINDIPIVLYLIERPQQLVDKQNIIIATSDELIDDSLIELCKTNNVPYYRCSLKNVALHFYNVIEKYAPKVFIRIIRDSPLIDPRIIEKLYYNLIQLSPDICANVFSKRYFPKRQSAENQK